MRKIERTPPYMQVVGELRAQILSGALAVGETIPSVRRMQADWEISQSTALKVVAALRAEGLVKPVLGVGTIVTNGEDTKILSTDLVAAPADIATTLGLEPGAQVIRRHRVTYSADGTPSSTSITYHPDREDA